MECPFQNDASLTFIACSSARLTLLVAEHLNMKFIGACLWKLILYGKLVVSRFFEASTINTISWIGVNLCVCVCVCVCVCHGCDVTSATCTLGTRL